MRVLFAAAGLALVAAVLGSTALASDQMRLMAAPNREAAALLLIADAAGIEPKPRSMNKAVELCRSGKSGLETIKRAAREIGLKLETADLTAANLRGIEGPVVAVERSPDEYAIYLLRGPSGVERLDSSGVRLVSWDEVARRFTGHILRMPQGAPRPAAAELQEFYQTVDVRGPGEAVKRQFRVTNKGAKPLLIDLRQISCRCATATSGNGSIPPGGSTEITMSAEPEEAGRSVYSATFDTNDPYWPRVVLVLDVKVPRTPKLYPETLFISLAGSRRSADEKVTLSAPPGVEAGSVSTTAKWLEARLGSRESVEGLTRWPVEVNVRDTVPLGESKAEVVVELAGGDLRSVRLPVTVRNFGVKSDVR
ncbi:MAG: DUF1573 domain-containing protein [Armatimonadota bacterium]|nr:DUF1573 domain-containing protein [Armatimonadota bacterium]